MSLVAFPAPSSFPVDSPQLAFSEARLQRKAADVDFTSFKPTSAPSCGVVSWQEGERQGIEEDNPPPLQIVRGDVEGI